MVMQIDIMVLMVAVAMAGLFAEIVMLRRFEMIFTMVFGFVMFMMSQVFVILFFGVILQN